MAGATAYLINQDKDDVILPSAYNGNDFIKGDIVVEKGSIHPYYKGADNQLQYFWRDANFNYYHSWVDNTTNVPIKDAPASIEIAPNEGVFFIGTDNKIHNYKWVASNAPFLHTILPYSYGVHSLDDYVRGGLAWDADKSRLYYGGFDGRLQKLEKTGTTWSHDWVNDYWSTHEYNTFDSTITGDNSPSLILGSDGPDKSIFYVRTYYNKGTESTNPTVSSDFHLSYFKYEPCHPALNPVRGALWPNTYRSTSVITETTTNANYQFDVFPNPSTNEINIASMEGITTNSTFILSDLSGRQLLTGSLNENETKVDITKYSSGIYLLTITDGAHVFHAKFSKI